MGAYRLQWYVYLPNWDGTDISENLFRQTKNPCNGLATVMYADDITLQNILNTYRDEQTNGLATAKNINAELTKTSMC